MKNRSRLKKFLTYAMSASMLLFMVSCVGEDNEEGPQGEQQPNEGVYRAELKSINSEIGGNSLAAGNVGVAVIGDEVGTLVTVNGAPPSIEHAQFIYEGGDCPTATDSTDGDPIVDAVEGIAKYGKILIPLDNDINSQGAGFGEFPSSDSDGKYVDPKSGSLNTMLEDLRAEDPNPADAFAKIPADSNINLDGRIVVIHGVPADTVLPETVDTIEGEPNTTTLPIACGKLVRVKTNR